MNTYATNGFYLISVLTGIDNSRAKGYNALMDNQPTTTESDVQTEDKRCPEEGERERDECQALAQQFFRILGAIPSRHLQKILDGPRRSI